MKPLISLSSEHFLSGINLSGAHGNPKDGLFFKAEGITSIFDAGSTNAVNNGLLMAGASGLAVSYGSVTGNIIGALPFHNTALANTDVIFSTSANIVARIEFTAGVPSGSLTTIFTAGHTLTPGLAVHQTAGGLTYIIYRQFDQMGRYETGGATQTDAWQALSSDYWGAMYRYFDLIIFGNGLGKIGTLDSSLAFNTSALTYDINSMCTAISDDSVYVILAITKNVAGDPTIFAETKILFWDSYSTHWLREYPISDPFIHSIEKTPIGIFAHGVTGIWQISFGGVKKVLSHSPGIYTVSGANVIHYGRATSFFSNSILWGGTGSGTARVINSWGELDSSFPSAHLQPVLSTPNKNITMVSGQLSKGYVFVADSTPQLFYYPVGSGTPATGLSAQTVYFQLGSKYNIEKVKVVFGEPLVSGDSMSIQFKTDEDASVTPTTALTATYATDGAVRSKNVRVAKFVADEQLSLVINFTAGAVKIKRIEVFGSLVPEV